jgi:hypothetical protein
LGKQNGNAGARRIVCSIACRISRFCGDGIVDTDRGEECDLAGNNGVKLDMQLQPASDPDAQVFCKDDCTIPAGIIY